MNNKGKELSVSIIILNYKTKKLTADCVNSVLDNKPNSSHEIIVVDNASNDGSVPYLEKRFGKRIKIVETKRNLGFGPGNNLGAKDATGYYLLFLNSDTIVQPEAIDTLINFADKHPEYGAMGPAVMLKNNKDVQPASFGKLPNIWRLLARNTTSKKPHLDSRFVCTETEWLTGAALLIPNEVYWAVGGFDSRYFMYFEDQDICANILKLGYEICVVNDARIIHLGGQSIINTKKRNSYYDESQEQFFIKHHGLITTWLMVALRLPWKLVRSITRKP